MHKGIFKFYLLSIFILIWEPLSAQNKENSDKWGQGSNPNQQYINSLEQPGRDEWQKPEEVISLFGDLEGKTIMDIGSGSGYFTFRLARKAGKVIAADISESFLKYIHEKMDRLEEEPYANRIELRKIPIDDPGLGNEETDGILVVDTYHHIDNRVKYFKKVFDGLKVGGKLIIVDFKKGNGMGPPDSMKINLDTAQHELNQAGFTNIKSNVDLLPYQYILICIK